MPVIDGSIGGSLSLQPSPQGTNSIPVSDVFSWLQLLTGLFAALMERSSAHTKNNIQPTAHAESSQRSRHITHAHTAFCCHCGPGQFNCAKFGLAHHSESWGWRCLRADIGNHVSTLTPARMQSIVLIAIVG